MAMTLRLSHEAEAALDQIVDETHLGKTAAIERALIEKAARTTRADRVRAAFDHVLERDAELLRRLADA